MYSSQVTKEAEAMNKVGLANVLLQLPKQDCWSNHEL